MRFAALSTGLVLTLLLGACVEVKAPPPPAAPRVVSFSADRVEIAPGELVTLSFRTENATEVQLLDDSGRFLELTGTPAEGSAVVSPSRTTFYVARVQGAGGRDAAFVQVAVSEPLREAFLLTVPPEVDSGEPAQLLWSAQGATELTLQTGTGTPVPLSGPTGTLTVQPARSERYTLSAKAGAEAPITTVATVRVRPQLLDARLEAPTGLNPGETVTLKWSTRGAEQVTVRERTFGQLEAVTALNRLDQGETQWVVPALLPSGLPVQVGLPLRFVVSAGSSGGLVESPVTAVVGDAPVIERFTAPAAATLGQRFFLAWNTLGASKVGVEVDGQLLFETGPGELARAAAGSVSVPTPNVPTTYTLVATNQRGLSVRATAMVRPAALPTISSFTVMPAAVGTAGDQVTARWMTANARRVQLRVQDGPTIGVNTTTPSDGSLTFAAGSGQVLVLEAFNEADDFASATRTLGFTGTPVATVTPTPTLRGTTATLSWSLAGLGVTEVVGLATPPPAPVPASSAFIDLSQSPAATELIFADPSAGAAEVPLPQGFRFPLLGVPQSTLWVSVNGFVGFAEPGGLSTNSDLTASNSAPSMLAPYWDDLTLGSSSRVLAGFGPPLASGERRYVVQWDQVERAGTTGTSLTFQVQLTERGQVTFVYGALNGSDGASATVGVKDAAQGVAQVFSFNSAALSDGLELNWFSGGPASGMLTQIADATRKIAFSGRTGGGLVSFSVPLVALAQGDLVISEAMPAPEVSVATTGQWVELKNTQDQAINLEGVTLRSTGSTSGGFTFPAGVSIPARGFLVVGQSTNATLNGGAGVSVVATDLPLDPMGDTVTLALGMDSLATLSWPSATAGRSVQVSEGLLTGPGGGGSLCTTGMLTFGPNGAIGTPGQENERCAPYTFTRIPGGFVDIAAGGTELLATASAYSGYGTVTLPRPFTYYGQSFTSINVSMVGFFTFGAPLTAAYNVTNDVLPGVSAPNGVVAPFWDEMVRNTGGHIWMRREADRTIVSWQDFRVYAVTGSSLNFQVHLLDTGVIEFHYGTFITTTAASELRARGSSATVWVEDPAGGSAVAVGVNTDGTIQQNSGIRFTP